MNNYAKELRRLLAENKFLTLPGVYDCLYARMAQEAGFPALFLAGGALAYSVLGKPDFGFLSLAEFGDAIQHIVSACRAPLLADADNGFGNAIQAANTGAVYEQLGAAGLQIDDKVLPASHPARNEIVDWEMLGSKIQAVRDSVSDDFVIVYRTCANLYGYGVEESIRRINLARERGVLEFKDAMEGGLEKLRKASQGKKRTAVPHQPGPGAGSRLRLCGRHQVHGGAEEDL